MFRKVLLGLLVVSGIGLFIAHRMGVRLNTTASLPLGLYIRTLADSDYVTFCLDDDMGRMALKRRYVSSGSCSYGGAPLLKKVVARPGDTVHLDDRGISVNGKLLENTEPRMTDSLGRQMKIYPFGTYVVQPGTFWVASTYDNRSFDSRYIGELQDGRLLMRVKPLLVARRPGWSY